MGFVNSAGLRTNLPLEEGADRRDITVSDVYEMFPFGNGIYCYELTYEDFLQVLNYSLTKSGKTLLSQLWGNTCYYTGQTVHAIATADGEVVYANGEWKDGWKDRKLKVALSEYVAITDRISDGMSNPFVGWNSTSRLVSNEAVDNISALEVL